ncbi:hypothetical protein PGTUg99_034660 [Puccinia graminis f. sp. tritici]|uniref:Uncharacterized protein n=1 Tax=Puccinia graminis f. sp. tritici TaxID=56615 RepID=A0A5B0S9Z2_PUCGR|nr:hypothetical protein PGTUg99_034660 [Puccinia graminis f. sp. tritici]
MIDYQASEEDKSQPALFLCRHSRPTFNLISSTLKYRQNITRACQTKKNMQILLVLLGLLLSREALAAPAPVKALVSRQESGEIITPPGPGCRGPICA